MDANDKIQIRCKPRKKRVCDRLENGKIEIRLSCCENHCLFYCNSEGAKIINEKLFGVHKLDK